MLLRNFSKGLATRVNPRLIDSGYATIMKNVDLTDGTLVPVKLPVTVGIADKYFIWYRHTHEVVSSSIETSWVEYRNILYSSSGTKNIDGIDYPIGIEKPTATLTGTGTPSGDKEYTYVYTYYDSVRDVESAPNTPSSRYKFPVTLSGFVASGNPLADKIRVYRSGTDLTEFTLVDTVGSNTSTYIDNKDPIDIAGSHILNSNHNNPMPTGLKYLTQAYAMLFGVKEDKIYFSDIGKPDAWSATNFLDFDDEITGIGATQNGILVFTRYSTYIVTGNSPTTFSYYLLDGQIGCINHYTIQFINNSLVWLGEDGIYSSSGGRVASLTTGLVGTLRVSDSTNAVVHDNKYYLNTKSRMTVLDFRSGVAISHIESNYDFVAYFEGDLYGVKALTLYKLFQGDYMEMHYKSGRLTEGSSSLLKLYKDIYIASEGSLVCNVSVNGVQCNTHTITAKQYNFKIAKNKGYDIQVEIKSSKPVYEIEYHTIRRQNAK